MGPPPKVVCSPASIGAPRARFSALGKADGLLALSGLLLLPSLVSVFANIIINPFIADVKTNARVGFQPATNLLRTPFQVEQYSHVSPMIFS